MFPLRYLGIPLRRNRLRAECMSLFESFERMKRDESFERLEREPTISQGKVLTLLNSVLIPTSICYMSYFVLPKWVGNNINIIQKRIMWAVPTSKGGKFHLMQ